MRFELPLPPPLNACYGVGVSRQGRPYSYKRTMAKSWQRDALIIIYQQVGKQVPTDKKVSVIVTLYAVRDRDIDSSHKLLLDTLQEANFIKNDKQVIELNTKKVYPSKIAKMVIDFNYVEPTSNENKD